MNRFHKWAQRNARQESEFDQGFKAIDIAESTEQSVADAYCEEVSFHWNSPDLDRSNDMDNSDTDNHGSAESHNHQEQNTQDKTLELVDHVEPDSGESQGFDPYNTGCFDSVATKSAREPK